MNVKKLVNNVVGFADSHQREILVGLEIAGIITTAVLAWRAAPKCEKIILQKKYKASLMETDKNLTEEEYKKEKKELTVETVKEVAPVILPPVIMGGLTIACAVAGYNKSTQQIAALTAAINLSKDAFNEYKEKTKEVVGEKKAQQITDEINAARVTSNPPTSAVINTGNGQTLCYDPKSGRYFYSSPEQIRKSFNIINKRMMDEYYISLNELYDEICLEDTDLGDMAGFNVDDGLIDIDHLFSSTLYNDIPVLVLNYEVSPKFMEHRGAMFR